MNDISNLKMPFFKYIQPSVAQMRPKKLSKISIRNKNFTELTKNCTRLVSYRMFDM